MKFAFSTVQFTDMFLPISVGGTVWFADKNAVEVSITCAHMYIYLYVYQIRAL